MTVLRSLAVALIAAVVAAPAIGQQAKPTPAPSMLAPTDHVLILIDHQPQMAFATTSIPIAELRNNVTGLAKSAKAFKVPVILTTVAEKSFAGPVFPEIKAALAGEPAIDRTTMNTWEDKRITDRVNKLGKKKVVIAALWTEVCGVGPALSALAQGYEVYFVSDASGGVSKEAHDMAMQRMVQAGVKPITWMQYLLELQRDWARTDTYEVVTGIAKEHGGGYGLGIIYAKEMFGAQEGK